MTLQFSTFGYFIITVFYTVATLMLIALWRTVQPGKFGITVLVTLGVVVLALPWADEVWIAYHFNEACKDAGVHVTRQVQAEGFYDDTTMRKLEAGPVVNQQFIEEFEGAGYRFMEYKSGDKIARIDNRNGGWVITIQDQPTARYHFRHTHDHDVIGYQLKKFERDVFDSLKSEVIGRDTKYARYPNTVERLWVHFLGSGQMFCRGTTPESSKLRKPLEYYVFKPVS